MGASSRLSIGLFLSPKPPPRTRIWNPAANSGKLSSRYKKRFQCCVKGIHRDRDKEDQNSNDNDSGSLTVGGAASTLTNSCECLPGSFGLPRLGLVFWDLWSTGPAASSISGISAARNS